MTGKQKPARIPDANLLRSLPKVDEIGRASCRERVCLYV